MNIFEALQTHFGYSSFREGQEPIINAILQGRDALGVMPTGGGKSICYQIPSLVLDGLTIVVSPLISLMKDQVMQLKENGIPAAFLNSSLTAEQSRLVYKNLYQGKYKLLYVAPERLEMQGFVETCRNINISLLAVDEAHCISEWGNDFRPSYLKISDFIKILPKCPPVAAFTATATERVRNDIEGRLGLNNPLRVVTGFDRPNLRFEVKTPKKKKDAVLELVSERKNKCGIIYTMSRSNVEKICEYLRNKGIKATRYHAGLSDDERKQNQEDFVYDRCSVMVATNAFGMGINKSNVNYVIHYNMPTSIESYYQEAGRAGRDGEDAECIMLFSSSDIMLAKRLIEFGENKDETVLKADYDRLEKMIAYCKSTKCLRGMLLGYFGQAHEKECGNCSNCNTTFKEKDITIEAQKILSCIKRIENKLGYNVGQVLVTRTLNASKDKRVLQLELDKLSTYGIMSEYNRSDINDIITYLVDNGYVYKDKDFGAISLTNKSNEILFGGKKVVMEYNEIPKTSRTKKDNSEAGYTVSGDLYEQLRELRAEIAKKMKVPAYIVFSNATLRDMAVKKPLTLSQFFNVSGVGHEKAARYGESFLKVIKDYVMWNE